jgi:vancomycin resistance protein YoaR
MRNYPTARPSYVRRLPDAETPPQAIPLVQAFLALAGGTALFFILLVVLTMGYGTTYSGEIYPGVRVGGVNVSGMAPAQAAVLLAQRLDYPQRGQIAFHESKENKNWVAHPSDLGLYLDTQSSAMAAYQVGRTGNFVSRLAGELQAWYSGYDLAPVFLYDERIAQNYLNGIASQVDRPIIEASLGVNGVDVEVHSGQVGRSMDVSAAKAAVAAQLQKMSDGVIEISVKETPPVIFDVSEQAAIAKKILSSPVTLTLPGSAQGDPGPWTLDQKELAGMLAIERVESDQGARYQVGLNIENIRPFLEGIAPKVKRDPQDARFTFNDDTKQLVVIQKSKTGRKLDVDASIQQINQKAGQGEHSIPLVMDFSNPKVSDDVTAEQLGIHELVSSQVSYFYGSGTSRIQNIQTAASRFHGVMVAPGEVFSMADILGDVSLDTGYAEALIIYGNRTIKGVGGGVCQVSTTLFRTVFFGGYPVVERYPHAYRVGYYEQTANGGYDADMAGLDATVFVPVVDFKFKNDSPYWLLMETYVNPKARTLTWKFYSTSDGRKVDWTTSGPKNIVDPSPPQYEENPDLQKGEIVQVDWEAQGADITVNRTVTRDGQTLDQDTFTTHYMPWRAVFQYGPGTQNIPTPEPTEKP